MAISAFALAATATSASAQSLWTGAIDNDWFKAGNWNPAGVPADNAWIDKTGPNTVIDGGAASVTGAVTVGHTAGSLGMLTIRNGGSLVSANGYIGQEGATAGIVTVDAASWKVDSAFYVGMAGGGSVLVWNGGKLITNYTNIADQSTSSGSVVVDGVGSAWNNVQEIEVGRSGNGRLLISNGGVVISAGARLGLNPDAEGILTVDGIGSRWHNSQGFKFGDFGNATVTIRNGGTISAPLGIILAEKATSVATLNFGAAAGDAPVAPGTVTVTAIKFGDGDGTIVFNHTSAAYSFSPLFIGQGRIDQMAGTTILTGSSAGFSGLTNVSGGQLIVNGTLLGTTFVTGGVLGGTGTVGYLEPKIGGTVAPGNGSIGTLTVTNHYGQAPGSIYQVDLASSGVSDRLVVGGIAQFLNGSMLQIAKADSGPYVAGTRYTVVTAATNISGTYTLTGDTQISAFLGFAAAYDNNNVYVDVLQTRSLTAAAQTANQLNTAAGLGTLPASGALSTAILNLPSDAAARVAFDQLSGEVHASIKSVLISDSQFLRDAAFGRLRSASGSPGTAMAPTVAQAECEAATSCATMDRVTFWTRAFGSWGRWNSDGNAATLWRDTGGFFLGADIPVIEDRGRVGLLVGYSRSSFQVSDRNSSGTSDNFHLGFYGGTQWGDLALRLGVAQTWHTLSTSRSIAFPGFTDTTKGNYTAGTTQVFGELGYGLEMGWASFEPFANVGYVSLRTDGFSETGGAAALSSWGSVANATFTTLGMRASTDFTLGNVNAVAKASAGWRHAFGGTTPAATFAFAGGGPFNVLGVPIAQDAAVIEAGFDFRLAPNATLGISYGGQFGSGTLDQSVRGNLSIKF
ncbi:autotransporter domain-containing protein [Reyranella sp.]|uniref:autotransporter outer membrane beta-barrel domain-containing protein n=1 Tax=Reyranella sp. TaxID=1929291 RepID=UPI0012134104|nr:autotransporter domain-containing protein [Reyranella sp.]TAJ88272.1 MAG: autotransporter outer membrane beta-barrel domain-containing protein [Reyranella sp.]